MSVYDECFCIAKSLLEPANKTTIFLNLSPEKCLARIIQRGRAAEKNLEVGYLENIHTRHLDFVKTVEWPVVSTREGFKTEFAKHGIDVDGLYSAYLAERKLDDFF